MCLPTRPKGRSHEKSVEGLLPRKDGRVQGACSSVKAKTGRSWSIRQQRRTLGEEDPRDSRLSVLVAAVLALVPSTQGSRLELQPSRRIVGPSRCALWWWLLEMLLLAKCLVLARTTDAKSYSALVGGWGGCGLREAGQRRAKRGRMRCEWEGKGKKKQNRVRDRESAGAEDPSAGTVGAEMVVRDLRSLRKC